MNSNVDAAVVTIVVRRDARGWVAEAASFGVVRARTLHTVIRLARELVVGAEVMNGSGSATGSGAAVPTPVGEIEYQFHTGDVELDRLVIRIRAARAAAQRLEARARQLTERALMLPSGGSVRDIGVLVGLSHQRVHQLMQQGNDCQGSDSEPLEIHRERLGDGQTGDELS